MTYGSTSLSTGKDNSKNTMGRSSSKNVLPMIMENPYLASDAANAKPKKPQNQKTSASAPSMTEEETKMRVVEDSKEFFSIRNLENTKVYFAKLPSEHRFRLVNQLVSQAIESKEADAQLVTDFFSCTASKNLCSPQSFEEGFVPVTKRFHGKAIDAPKTFNLMTMMKGAGQLR